MAQYFPYVLAIVFLVLVALIGFSGDLTAYSDRTAKRRRFVQRGDLDDLDF